MCALWNLVSVWLFRTTWSMNPKLGKQLPYNREWESVLVWASCIQGHSRWIGHLTKTCQASTLTSCITHQLQYIAKTARNPKKKYGQSFGKLVQTTWKMWSFLVWCSLHVSTFICYVLPSFCNRGDLHYSPTADESFYLNRRASQLRISLTKSMANVALFDDIILVTKLAGIGNL